MPAGAIATGVVDIIAPVEEIPAHLMRLNNAPQDLREAYDAAPPADVQKLEICSILRTQLGHDFSGYRSQTFLRRVERRMHVVDAGTLSEYIEKLNHSPEEVTLLFRDLLIRVTSFFRDKETFDALAAHVIPRLFEGKMADSTVRLWVPGCATGEEAYFAGDPVAESIWIPCPPPPKVQLFATGH